MGQGRQYGALKEEKGGRSAPLHHLLCHHARQVKPPPFTHPFWPFRHTLSPSYLFTYYFDSLRSLSTLLPPPLGFPFPQTCLFAGSLCGKLELILALRLFFSFLFVRMLITKWQLCFCQGMGARYGTQRSVIKFRVFMV